MLTHLMPLLPLPAQAGLPLPKSQSLRSPRPATSGNSGIQMISLNDEIDWDSTSSPTAKSE